MLKANEKPTGSIVTLLGVEHDRFVATPMVDYPVEEIVDSPVLDPVRGSLYRSAVGTALYVAPIGWTSRAQSGSCASR